jgi:fructose-1,6-bisphosphatase
MQIPEDTSEFAINASNQRFWAPHFLVLFARKFILSSWG